MRKRIEVYYSGRVQGVGFRFVTREIASGHRVRGFVKNLYDGRVQLIAEGEEKELDAFLERIDLEMGSYIKGRKINRDEARDEFDRFEIRF
jgi:acylphosphatase